MMSEEAKTLVRCGEDCVSNAKTGWCQDGGKGHSECDGTIPNPLGGGDCPRRCHCLCHFKWAVDHSQSLTILHWDKGVGEYALEDHEELEGLVLDIRALEQRLADAERQLAKEQKQPASSCTHEPSKYMTSDRTWGWATRCMKCGALLGVVWTPVEALREELEDEKANAEALAVELRKLRDTHLSADTETKYPSFALSNHEHRRGSLR